MDDIRPFKSRLEREVLEPPGHRREPLHRLVQARRIHRAEQARAFLIQFSVFSNQFLVAQLQKVLNAETLEEMRASKEILANEIGVGFRGGQECGRCGARRHGGQHRRRHLSLPGGALRAARANGASIRNCGSQNLGKRRLGNARHAVILRRAAAPIRARGLRNRGGGLVGRRELGGGRFLGRARATAGSVTPSATA